MNKVNGEEYSGNSDKQTQEEILDTPLFNNSVYNKLPSLLQKGCDLFPSSSRDRDIFFTAALALSSGCFQKSYFYYDNKPLHFNLYAMIVAPPASGKGIATFAAAYIKQIEEYLEDEFKAQTVLNEILVKSEISVLGEGQDKSRKTKLRRKRLVIPANSSSASFLGIFNDSNGQGIIFETEADTLASAFKMDWSDYSESIRKAYHHETISFSRKMDDVFVEVKRPQLSILITGTPRQVGAMALDNPENGLQSRFFFYIFDNLPVFKKMSGRVDNNMESALEIVSAGMKDIYQQLSYDSEGVEFCLTNDQWRFFSRWYERKLEKVARKYNSFSSAIVTRGAVGTIRIAGILSFMLEAETNPFFTCKVNCTWQTLRKAIDIADTYITHSLVIFQSSPMSAPDISMHQYMDFYNLLPDGQFSRKDVLEIASAVGFRERTVDRRLEKLRKSGRLILVKGGIYKKK